MINWNEGNPPESKKYNVDNNAVCQHPILSNYPSAPQHSKICNLFATGAKCATN